MEYAAAERDRFSVLNGWRGVCAMVVALHHLNAYGHFYELPLVVNAWLFVDFFFVLSGFIISYAYSDRLGTWPSTRAFAIRRFGRLWPLHAAVLAPLVALELMKLAVAHSGGLALERAPFGIDNNTAEAIASNLLLVQSLGVHDVLTWNRPSWSISTEFYTYLVFALFLLLARDERPRTLLAFAVAAIGAGVVLLFSKTAMNTTWDFGFFRCLYGFFIGHLTHRLWASGRWRLASSHGGPAEIASVGFAVWFVSSAGETRLSLLAPLVFAILVFVFAQERGPISKQMHARPILQLGAWSYSIYMVHWPLVDVLGRAVKFSERFTQTPATVERTFPWEDGPVELIYVGNQWAMDGLAVAYLLLVAGVAALTYRLIEQPGRRFFNRLALRLDRAPAPLAMAGPAATLPK